MKWKCYVASGWFSPAQDEQLTKLEKVFDDRADFIELASPRRIFVCPPDSSLALQESVFQGNIQHIKDSEFILANSSFKDVGSVFEFGVAYAFGKKIVYFCEGLPEGAKFNLMLSRSGHKVCTSFAQLEDYIERCRIAGEILYEPYDKEIE